MELSARYIEVGGYLSKGNEFKQSGITSKQLSVALLRSGAVIVKNVSVCLFKQGIQKPDMESRVRHQPFTNHRGWYDQHIGILQCNNVCRNLFVKHYADVIGKDRIIENKSNGFRPTGIVDQRVLEASGNNPTDSLDCLTGICEILTAPIMVQLTMLLA